MDEVLIMRWGKYKGKRVDQLPRDYCRWLLKNSTTLTPTLRDALTRRAHPVKSVGGGERFESVLVGALGAAKNKILSGQWTGSADDLTVEFYKRQFVLRPEYKEKFKDPKCVQFVKNQFTRFLNEI